MAWRTGAPARAILVAAIRTYRFFLSGMLGGQCRYYPSCSHYAEEAVRVRGALVGSLLAVWRVLRCNPYSDGGIDPVKPRPGVPVYDHVISKAGQVLP